MTFCNFHPSHSCSTVVSLMTQHSASAGQVCSSVSTFLQDICCYRLTPALGRLQPFPCIVSLRPGLSNILVWELLVAGPLMGRKLPSSWWSTWQQLMWTSVCHKVCRAAGWKQQHTICHLHNPPPTHTHTHNTHTHKPHTQAPHTQAKWVIHGRVDGENQWITLRGIILALTVSHMENQCTLLRRTH